MLDAISTIQMQELSVFTVGHKEQTFSLFEPISPFGG